MEGLPRIRQEDVCLFDRTDGANGPAQQGKQAVVGQDQPAGIGPGGQDAAAAAHPRVDYRQMDRPLREPGDGRGEQEGARGDVARGHLMGDVDDLAAGREAEDRALDRGHVVVGGPEVGQEGEESHSGYNPASCRAAACSCSPSRPGKAESRLA